VKKMKACHKKLARQTVLDYKLNRRRKLERKAFLMKIKLRVEKRFQQYIKDEVEKDG